MRTALLLVFLLISSPLMSREGRLQDDGNFLEPTEKQRLQQSLDKAAASGLHITILTVMDQGGRSVRDFSLQKAAELKLHEARTTPAALIVLSRKEKKLDLLVSPAWEWTLPDSLTAFIKREMINQFKYGDFYDGLAIGIERLKEKQESFAATPDYVNYEELAEDLQAAKGSIVQLELSLVTKEFKAEKLSEEQFHKAYFVYAKAANGTLVKVHFSRTAYPLVTALTDKGSATIIARVAATNPLDVELLAVVE